MFFLDKSTSTEENIYKILTFSMLAIFFIILCLIIVSCVKFKCYSRTRSRIYNVRRVVEDMSL